MTATAISTVFAPELFVLVVTILVVGYELRNDGLGWQAFVSRTLVVAGAWALALLAYEGGSVALSGPVPGGDDFFASVGLIAGFVAIWIAWRRLGWGAFVPAYSSLLIATSLVHVVVVPVWDVSSHVLYAVVPSGYLATVDRRFGPLLSVPVLLAWSRVAVGAHTTGEVLGAFAIGVGAIALGASRGTATEKSGFR